MDPSPSTRAPPYATLVDRVEGSCRRLGAAERPLAERVVAICRQLCGRARDGGQLVPVDGDLALRRELGALTEQLGRRAALALPAAALGRAALADLFGDLGSCRAITADCDAKLELLGC